MRRHLLLIFVVTLLAIPLSAQFRRKPKPAPTPNKPAAQAHSPVDLAVEPRPEERLAGPSTLRAAAEANDFEAFDNLYQRAAKRHEPLGAYADLHEVWSYAQLNAAGSFFGADLYARIAARYPEYSKFIREYRVVDHEGHAFYPTQETRTFLLAQAIADVDPVEAKTPAKNPVPAAAPAPARTVSEPQTPKSPLHPVALERKAVAQPAVPPERPQPPAGDHVIAPLAAEPLPSADALTSDIAQASTETAATPAERDDARNRYSAASVMTGDRVRGIFLVILGLLGVGLISITMQTPAGNGDQSDEPHL